MLITSIYKIVRFNYINIYEWLSIRAVLLLWEHVSVFRGLFVCSPSIYYLEHRGVSYHFTVHRTTVEREITIVLRLRQYQTAMRLYNERHS